MLRKMFITEDGDNELNSSELMLKKMHLKTSLKYQAERSWICTANLLAITQDN